MIVNQQLHSWLVTYGIIKPILTKDDKYRLTEQDSQGFMDGIKFAQLLKQMYNQPQILLNLKQARSAGMKLFNWNLISDAMNKLNIPLDSDIKQLIVQGDTDMMVELLRDLYEKHNPQQLPSQITDHQQDITQSNANAQSYLQDFGILQEETIEKTVNINDVNPNKNLMQTKSLLEYFLVSLSKCLKIKPRLAVQLLQQNNKYLSQILIKGYKDVPITNWLTEVYASLSQVVYFVTREQSQIEIFLSAIKPGLVSKHQDVAEWVIRIYIKMIDELMKVELIKIIYEWFSNQGITTTFLCIQRHPQLISQICELYNQISRYNINDFYNIQFRQILSSGKEYLDLVNVLIENGKHREVFVQNGLIDFWHKISIKIAENEVQYNISERISALKYLSLSWIYYPQVFEQNEHDLNQYLGLMKKLTRDHSTTTKLFSHHMIFRILDHLAGQRNPYAGLLYKKMTFSIIEMYNEPETKEFLLQNMIYIIKKYSSIPLEIMIDPYVRQMQLSNQEMNLADIQLLKTATLHPKVTIVLAIQMLDLLTKVYLNSIPFSSAVFSPLQLLMAKFVENEPIQEYCFNLTKSILSLYYDMIDKKKTPVKMKDKTVQVEIEDKKRLNQQKKALILELVRYMINLRQQHLNSQIMKILVHFYKEIKKNLKEENKGIITLILQFGSLNEIVQQVELQGELEQQQLTKQQQPRSETIQKRDMIKRDNEGQLPKISVTQYKNRSSDYGISKDPFQDMRQDQLLEQQGRFRGKQTSDQEILGQMKLSQEEQELMKQFDMIY